MGIWLYGIQRIVEFIVALYIKVIKISDQEGLYFYFVVTRNWLIYYLWLPVIGNEEIP